MAGYVGPEVWVSLKDVRQYAGENGLRVRTATRAFNGVAIHYRATALVRGSGDAVEIELVGILKELQSYSDDKLPIYQFGGDCRDLLHALYVERVRKVLIEFLDIDNKDYARLRREGILTIGDILKTGEADLRAIPLLRQSGDEIVAAIHELGLEFDKPSPQGEDEVPPNWALGAP